MVFLFDDPAVMLDVFAIAAKHDDRREALRSRAFESHQWLIDRRGHRRHEVEAGGFQTRAELVLDVSEEPLLVARPIRLPPDLDLIDEQRRPRRRFAGLDVHADFATLAVDA